MKKKVDVYCHSPFRIGYGSFTGRCESIVLDVESIRTCLINKALVWELTKDGKRVQLDFSNYRDDNGGVVDDKAITAYDTKNKVTPTTVITVKKEIDPATNEEKNVIEKQEPKKKSNVMTEISVKTVVDDKKEEKSAAVEEKKNDKAPAQTDKNNNNQYNNKNNKYNNNKH